MASKKTAIVLFNLGGPDKQSSVKPFLFNLFNDKAIISLPQPFRFLLAKFISSKREKTAQEIYAQIGGKSPIYEITKTQAEALERELSYDGGDFKTFIAMRYWNPFAKDAVAKIAKYQPDEIIFLPLYPQFSSATTASSFDDFDLQLKKAGISASINLGEDSSKNLSENKVVIKKVCCYFDDEEFILSHAKLIKKKVQQQGFRRPSEFRILFSAQGLPQKIIDAGDPYVFQIEVTATKVMEKLQELLEKDGSFGFKNAQIDTNSVESDGKIDFQVCYQSKVGLLEWTSPSLGDEIKRVAADGKSPVITPIAFVCEHSETLVEFDIEYKELADDLGVEKYSRVEALNIDGHFIKSLTKICRSVSAQESGFFVGCKKGRACPKEFSKCRNNS